MKGWFIQPFFGDLGFLTYFCVARSNKVNNETFGTLTLHKCTLP